MRRTHSNIIVPQIKLLRSTKLTDYSGSSLPGNAIFKHSNTNGGYGRGAFVFFDHLIGHKHLLIIPIKLYIDIEFDYENTTTATIPNCLTRAVNGYQMKSNTSDYEQDMNLSEEFFDICARAIEQKHVKVFWEGTYCFYDEVTGLPIVSNSDDILLENTRKDLVSILTEVELEINSLLREVDAIYETRKYQNDYERVERLEQRRVNNYLRINAENRILRKEAKLLTGVKQQKKFDKIDKNKRLKNIVNADLKSQINKIKKETLIPAELKISELHKQINEKRLIVNSVNSKLTQLQDEEITNLINKANAGTLIGIYAEAVVDIYGSGMD